MWPIWPYNDMCMKEHVLELGNSMVASDKSFKPNQNPEPVKPLKFANLANFGPTVTCCKKHVLELEISMVATYKSFEPNKNKNPKTIGIIDTSILTNFQ